MEEKGCSGFMSHVVDVHYFIAGLIKNLLARAAFESYYLKLSLPSFFNVSQFLPNFSLTFLIDIFLIEKRVYAIIFIQLLISSRPVFYHNHYIFD